MLKINYISTLFVGIDVSSKSNVVCAIDFHKNQLIKTTVSNNQPGAYNLICQIVSVMYQHTDLNTVVVALESSSIYSVHIAKYEPLNISIASSFNCINAFNRKIKVIDKAIAGLNTSAYTILISIDGIDPVFAAGNRYLRYYLGETTNSMRNHNVEYHNYYYKKYNEVPKHKRALALASRKLVRLIFGLLTKEQLYSTDKVDTLS